MSNDMRIVKFKMIIRDIWGNLDKRTLTSELSDLKGGYINDGYGMAWLAIVYDYDKLNDYGKVIMDQVCELDEDEFGDEATFEYVVESVEKCKDVEYRMKAAKALIMYVADCDNSWSTILRRREALHFMFWSLMILAVDDEDKEEYLSLICDFAKMLKISDEEMMDLVRVIRIIYQMEENIDIQTKDIKRWFAKVVGKYRAN